LAEAARTYPGQRTLWAGQDRSLHDLVRSAFASLLLSPGAERPIYISAPSLLDAPLFENDFGQYSGLFPLLADRSQLGLGEVIVGLGKRHRVRLMTRRSKVAEVFVATHLQAGSGVEVVLSDAYFGEVGILAPTLFVSGSLLFSARGVSIGDDLVTYSASSAPAGVGVIASAYPEFDRRWILLGGRE